MKKSWQNTVFLYIYQVVGVYGWEQPRRIKKSAERTENCWRE